MIPARCANCGIPMNRTGVEKPTAQGIIVSFECPSCHSRAERAVSKMGGRPQ